MKTIRALTASNVALALTLLALRPALSAAEPAVDAARDKASSAAAHADERKAALAEIDARIAIIEKSVEHAPDDAARSALRERLESLKKRRAELRKDYVAAKAAELRADTHVEYQKVLAWTKGAVADAKDAVVGPEPGATDTATAAINPKAVNATAHLALYRMNPSPENKEEVKAALAALDAEIDRLQARAKAMPKGPERDALRKRAKALDDRRDELAGDFTKARWDAVVSDVKAEWDRITD